MAGEKLKKTQESDKQVPTRQRGSSAAPIPIPTHARHIGPRQHDVGIPGGWLDGPPPRGGYKGSASSEHQKRWALEIDLFRPFSDAAGKWKLELFDKGPSGDTLLATFEGTTKHQGYDLKIDRFEPKNTDLPEGQRCLLPVFFSRIFHAPGEGMGKTPFQQILDEAVVYYVPLKGHQDYANESWTLSLKCSIDDGVVHEDEDDLVHVYIDWPRGAIVYPMLGAPALVGKSDPWLELLVALDRPLGEGAERFLLRSMLRIFPWGDKGARQEALRKRTFQLADPDGTLEFRRHTFADVGTDAKDAKGIAETSDGFRLRLGQMEHFALAETELSVPEHAPPPVVPVSPGVGAPVALYAKVPEPQPRATAPVTIPVLCEFDRTAKEEPVKLRAPPASALSLYKVRVKLDKSKGLYDLVWMTGEDFAAANRAVKQGSSDPIRPAQDQRLRDALHAMSRGAQKDAAVNARVPYKLDGAKQSGDDDWQPTRNQPSTLEESFEILRSHHPVSLFDDGGSFKLGHLTDIHLDVRLDIMAQSTLRLIPESAGLDVATPPIGSLVNNYNATFTELAGAVLAEADALVLTGDLIDYNRGFALSPDGDVGEKFAWKLGLSPHEKYSAYKHERNWILFFQVLKRLYDKHRKPIFTTLGNHDYRPNPYSVYPGVAMPWATYSIYPTIGGDLNLTLTELAACYGPKFSTWTPKGSEIRAEVASLSTTLSAPRWYHYAINAWKDYAVGAGSVSLLMMDWDCDESLFSVHKGSMLPRAELFMTRTQRGIYKRWVEGPALCKVLCCHPTLACNSAAIGISNADARRGQALDDMNHGTMGKRTITGGDAHWVRGVREGIASDVAHKRVMAVLTGHSHMDGIYAPSPDGARVTMTHPTHPSWGREMTFPADVSNRIIVTNSGGPLGEFTEDRWTRRSRPAGSVFTLTSSSMTMKHVASKRRQATPRRCVHDVEHGRVLDGRFNFRMSLDELSLRTYLKPGPPYEGVFTYLLDPEDASLDRIAALALVLHTREGRWERALSGIVAERTQRIEDPNGGGHVDAVDYTFRFPRLLAGTALIDKTSEAYVIVMYDGDARDNWVIPVEGETETERSAAPGYTAPRVEIALVDKKFPSFDAGHPRWSSEG